MTAAARKITRDDLMPDAEFAKVRRERRAGLLPMKRLRRIDLGPFCSFYFECYETMLFQIQEMLLIEKGGESKIPDPPGANQPTTPPGSEVEKRHAVGSEHQGRRAAVLARLGGVEDRLFAQVRADKVYGLPEGDIERTRDDGKTSSVHFLHFPLTSAQIAVFRDPATQVMVGCDHEHYGHLAALSPANRAELARDFA